MGISLWLIRWIVAMLVFRFGSWILERIEIAPGLPQVSTLSPVLFNIYAASVARLPSASVGRSLVYADDILLYRQEHNGTNMIQELKISWDYLSSWCDNYNAMITLCKARVLWCPMNIRAVKEEMLAMHCSGMQVKRVDDLNYLGMTLDPSLPYYRHIDHVVQ